MSELLDEFLELLSTAFEPVFNFFYDLIFVDSAGLISTIGQHMFTLFSGSFADGSFIFIFCGIIIFTYILNLVINAVRG